MSALRLGLFCLSLLTACFTTAAFEVSTHDELTAASLNKSVLSNAAFLTDIGLPPATDGIYTVADGTPKSALAAVRFGTAFEDSSFVPWIDERVFNHFFDPQFNNFAGRGLQKGGLTAGRPSPDWALEDRGELLNMRLSQPQIYSFRNGQQYFFAGLAGATPADRQLAFGRMFQSLGHVVHHIQDMSQPQHVRNDGHTHFDPNRVGDAPWTLLERHTERNVNNQIPDILQKNPYASGNPPGLPKFATARQFWHTPGAATAQYVGMAEFTAQNYPSYGTQFEAYRAADGTIKARSASGYPLPSGIDATGTEKRVVSETRQVNLLNGTTRIGNVEFLRGKVFDGFTGGTTDQRLALSSLANVAGAGGFSVVYPLFKEDAAVFDDWYRVLFPRAVAFSAGLIDHFFRGRLNLRRAASGNALLVDNTGLQAMNGNVYIYYEDSAGVRRPVPGASARAVLAPAQTLAISGFTEPVGATKLIAAFQGQIGAEGDPTTASGWYAVAGKVIAYAPPPQPAIACGTPISATGGTAGYTKKMDLGTATGAVRVQFEAYAIPDSLLISRAGATVVTSGGQVAGLHDYSFLQDSGAERYVDVRVTGNTNVNTEWTLTVSCPGGPLAPPKPTVQVSFGTEPSQQCGISCKDLPICGYYNVKVNGQYPGYSGGGLSLTAGSNVLMEVAHSEPTCGFGIALKGPGTFYYRDNQGVHYLRQGTNWVQVQ